MFKLVVLDMNDVLLYKTMDDLEDKISNNLTKIKLNRMILYFKPGIISFLEKLSKTCDIALWTSGNEYNFKHFTNWIKENSSIKFRFIWYRDMCEMVGDEGHETIKKVKRIIKSPTINYNRIYNENNILIVDNDLTKVGMNKNYLIIEDKYKEDLMLGNIEMEDSMEDIFQQILELF